ncbi:MAG: phosphodiester glycosidase family protein [Candidatus Sumerlaeia bacterium]|nr:phosphodiester glycosidase family protein [Candidatus Sumerlaeia bacterium]
MPLFGGIDYATTETAVPVPMKLHALRIHLDEPGIEFFVTPSNGDEPLDTSGLCTSTFLETYKCQAAINASPFHPVIQKERTPQDVLGLSLSRGDLYSPPNETYGVLLISRDNRARIETPPIRFGNAWNGVGGFRLLLKDGRNVAAQDVRHPRTAAGISRNGRFLFLVVLDGRQKGYSEGATTTEMAQWMRAFGAWDALNLDGGGSTTMVVKDGQGRARVLNRPIDMGIPGKQRVVANHLGVFARSLEKPRR